MFYAAEYFRDTDLSGRKLTIDTVNFLSDKSVSPQPIDALVVWARGLKFIIRVVAIADVDRA